MRKGVEFEIDNIKMHTFDDWNIFFTSFDIPAPTIKTSYIDIDGADGSIDMTEVFGISYNDLAISLNFQVVESHMSWNSTMRKIKAFLHGKIAKITMYNDEEYYYLGRCTVSDFKSSRVYGTFSIDALVKPYKFKKDITIVEDDIIDEKEVVFHNECMNVLPSFECSGDMLLEFKGNTYAIGTEKTKIPDLIFKYGENTIKFKGNGHIKVSYQEGAL